MKLSTGLGTEQRSLRRIVSMIFRDHTNLQTGHSGLEMFKEVKADTTDFSTKLPPSVLLETLVVQLQRLATVLPWAQSISGVQAQPEESFPPQWGE